MLRIISFTEQGLLLADRIAGQLPARIYRKFRERGSGRSIGRNVGQDIERGSGQGIERDSGQDIERGDGKNPGNPSVEEVTGSLEAWAEEAFRANEPVLFIGAAGIAVRSIAGCIRSKLTDVPVLVMDMTGQFVIPILSGHYGGANRLAEQLAEITGAVPVITTATDQTGAFAADLFAKEQGLIIRNPEALPYVSGKAVAGEMLRISFDTGLESYGKGVVSAADGITTVADSEAADIRITIRPLTEDETTVLYLTPKIVCAGIGCRKGVDPGKLRSFVLEKCMEAGVDPSALAGIASIEQKKEEPAILRLAEEMGIPFYTYTAEELQAVEGEFADSAFVEETVGVGNVSERAAARMAGPQGKSRMLLRKTVGEGMTLALAMHT